jgi:hypothetical protein
LLRLGLLIAAQERPPQGKSADQRAHGPAVLVFVVER